MASGDNMTTTLESPPAEELAVPQPQQLFPDSAFIPMFHIVNISSLVMTLFGFVSNILNIIVFYKIGLTTTINICFFSLAVSDLISVIYVFIRSLSMVPKFETIYTPFNIEDLCYVIGALPFSCYAFGAWVTTLISLERSCSVVFPMKVKQIFTNRNVTFLLVAMVIYQLACGTLWYLSIALTTEKFPGTNLTTIRVDHGGVERDFSILSLTLTFSGPTYTCFCIVIVATVFLIVNLNKSKKKREEMTGKKTDEKAASKDAKVIKTVILICVLFLSGFITTVAQFITTQVYPDLSFLNPYLGNIDRILLEISFFTQNLSSSVNILVYWKMNSTYRNVFNKMFNRDQTA